MGDEVTAEFLEPIIKITEEVGTGEMRITELKHKLELLEVELKWKNRLVAKLERTFNS